MDPLTLNQPQPATTAPRSHTPFPPLPTGSARAAPPSVSRALRYSTPWQPTRSPTPLCSGATENANSHASLNEPIAQHHSPSQDSETIGSSTFSPALSDDDASASSMRRSATQQSLEAHLHDSAQLYRPQISVWQDRSLSSIDQSHLVFDNFASYPGVSVDRECGKNVQGGRLLKTDVDGASGHPQTSTAPIYGCTFHFLGCRFTTPDESHWRLHNTSHLHRNAPPTSVLCPLCDLSFNDTDDGCTAWDARMSHLAAHFRIGETLVAPRPDFELFRYLWQKRIINDAQYGELQEKGSLSAQPINADDLTCAVEKLNFDEDRHTRPTVKGEDVGIARLSERQSEAHKEFHLPIRRTIVLGPDFIEFVVEELQEVEDLLEVIVITGEEHQAFAAPCLNYAEKTWPELGRPLLLALVLVLKPLKDFLRLQGRGSLETGRDIRLGKSLLISALLVRDHVGHSIDFQVQGDERELLEMVEIFKWLSAACRKPVPDQLLCSQVMVTTDSTSNRIKFFSVSLKTPWLTNESGRCWHSMFKGYVLAERFPAPRRGHQHGIELPFDLMTLLGLVLYTVNFGRGIVLKGENTALIPSIYGKDEDSVQWHYLEGDGAGGPLTWEHIKKHCRNIYPSKDFKLLQSKRTFVGYFASATVHLGTRDSGFDKVDFSGAQFDDKTAFVLGNELTGQLGTSVMNFFTAQVSGKLMVHRTAHQRLRGVHNSILDKVRNSKNFPILLFDVRTKQGWLVPELSAVLHMALAWASYQHQSDQVLKSMPFAEARPNGGEAAYDAILESADLLLPEHIKVGDNEDRQLSVLQALVPFFARIGQIKDQQLQRHACGLRESKDLVGYEFKEIASFEEHLQLRRAKVDVERSGGWLRLVSSKPEMAVILCSHLADPIQPASPQQTCPFWEMVPTDQYFLTASIPCLRELAKRCGGEDTLRLYNDIYCIPSKRNPSPGACGTRKWPCCNPLLELSKHPSKSALQFEDEAAIIIGKAVPQVGEHSSLRVFLRSRISEKDGKPQNGNSSMLQQTLQNCNGSVDIPSHQQSQTLQNCNGSIDISPQQQPVPSRMP